MLKDTAKFSQEFKKSLLEKVLGDDKSDVADHLRLTCEALGPDPKVKEKVWNELIDPNSKMSVYDKYAYMEGFYNFNQIDIIRPYFDKFYDVLPIMSD